MFSVIKGRERSSEDKGGCADLVMGRGDFPVSHEFTREIKVSKMQNHSGCSLKKSGRENQVPHYPLGINSVTEIIIGYWEIEL